MGDKPKNPSIGKGLESLGNLFKNLEPVNPEQNRKNSKEYIREVFEALNEGNIELLKQAPVEIKMGVAKDLLKIGAEDFVLDNLQEFPGVNAQEVLDKLLDNKPALWPIVLKHLDRFQGLNRERALKLFKGFIFYPGNRGGSSFDDFETLFCSLNSCRELTREDYETLITELERIGYGRYVVSYPEIFPKFSFEEIAEYALNKNFTDILVSAVGKYKGLSLEVAERLIKNGLFLDRIAYHAESFRSEDHKKIALALIKIGKGDLVKEYLDKFTGLSIADKMELSALLENQ